MTKKSPAVMQKPNDQEWRFRLQKCNGSVYCKSTVIFLCAITLVGARSLGFGEGR